MFCYLELYYEDKHKTAVWEILLFGVPNIGHRTALAPRHHVTKALRQQPAKLMTVSGIHDRNEKAAPCCTVSLCKGLLGGWGSSSITQQGFEHNA